MGDAGGIFGRQVCDVSCDDVLGVGPRRVGVRVVALDEDALGADGVEGAERGRVVDRAEPEVTPQHLAREQVALPGPALGAGCGMGEDEVGAVGEHGDPAETALVEGDVQLREADGDARPEPIRSCDKGIDREQRGDGLERGVGSGDRRPLCRSGVEADDGVGFLAGGQERIPDAGVQAGQPALGGQLGEAHGFEAAFGIAA